jgi:hypothetical protein
MIACQTEHKTDGLKSFGGEVTLEKAVSIADIYADPGKYEGEEIRIDGKIAQVCQHKGCWIKMAEGDKALIVRFKDYGFFVPKDAASSKVTIQGIFTTEVDEHVMEETHSQEEGDHAGHAHGEENEPKHAEGKDRDTKEEHVDPEMPYSFVAHAVIIYKSAETDI